MDRALIRATRAVGMQAQTIPRPISMPEKNDVLQLSQEKFSEFAKVARDANRRILMTVTLECAGDSTLAWRSCKARQEADATCTYSVPTQNMRPTPTFLFHPRFRLCSLFIGIASIQTSTAMPTMALVHPSALKLIHAP